MLAVFLGFFDILLDMSSFFFFKMAFWSSTQSLIKILSVWETASALNLFCFIIRFEKNSLPGFHYVQSYHPNGQLCKTWGQGDKYERCHSGSLSPVTLPPQSQQPLHCLLSPEKLKATPGSWRQGWVEGRLSLSYCLSNCCGFCGSYKGPKIWKYQGG